MKDPIELYKELSIDERDPKWQYISNWTKFQSAKNAGEFDDTFETYWAFLKYEVTHKNRRLIRERLFAMAFQAYKTSIAERFKDLLYEEGL